MKLGTGKLLAVDIDVDKVLAANEHLTSLLVEDFVLSRVAADMLAFAVERNQHQETQEAHGAEVAHIYQAVIDFGIGCAVELTTHTPRVGLVCRFAFGDELIGTEGDLGVEADVADVEAVAVVDLNNVCRGYGAIEHILHAVEVAPGEVDENGIPRRGEDFLSAAKKSLGIAVPCRPVH